MYTAYVNYIIWFADLAEYNAAVVTAGGNGYGHCPLAAATEFGIAWPLVGGGPLTGTKGIYGTMPYGIPASPGPGIEIQHPNASSAFLKSDLDSVIVPGQGAVPPSGLITPGEDMNLVWWGNITYSPNEVAGAPPITPMPQRRWITGFGHLNTDHELGTGFTASGGRASSRTMDGLGLSIVGANQAAFGGMTRSVDTYRPGLTPKTSWERLYIRIKATPAADFRFWRFHTTINALNGGSLSVTPAGELIVESIAGTGVATILGTTPALILNKWYLLDTLLTLPTLAVDIGRLRVYINHVLAIDGTNDSGTGIDFLSTHTFTEVGDLSAGDADIILDIGDWMCADVPNNGGVESLDSIDWLLGTHIRASNILSGNMGTFTGDIGFANQFNDPENSLGATPTSATALDTVEGLTDLDESVAYSSGTPLGIASIASGCMCKIASGAVACRIGYKLAGGATVWANVTPSTVPGWRYNYYNPSGLTLPAVAAPFSVLFEKANNAVLTTLYALGALVEYVGAWGVEDDPTFPNFSNIGNLHNARFANSLWGYPQLGPLSADVYAIGGTYVGNGTTKDINLPGPTGFIWIRALTGGSLGIKYLGPHVDTHNGLRQQSLPNLLVRIWVDNTGQYKFTVTGTNAENNANGVTYQYIAFCDPGMRFNATGTFNVPFSHASEVVPLYLTDFTPQAAFTVPDYLLNGITTAIMKYKGPGQAGDTGANLAGSAYANWGNFALGSINVLADNIINIASQQIYSAWRMIDPSGYLMVQLTGYVGDGLGVRIIPLPFASGRFPLFALVVTRATTAAWFRDPSHAGNDSSNAQTLAIGVTSIVGGGVDQIVVGNTLNGLGAIYDVFVIMGDSAGWNNGVWTPPSTVTPGVWSEPPYVPGNLPIITGDGGMNFNGEAPLLAVEDLSGIYTLVPNKRSDTIYTGIGSATIDVKFPNPTYKTGYVGG
jgi:hypothetical protein